MRYKLKPGLTSSTFEVFDDRTNSVLATFYDMISAYDYVEYKNRIQAAVDRMMVEISKGVDEEFGISK